MAFSFVQIAFKDISVIGQRLDDKQMWLSFQTDPQCMATDLSLRCQCVAELVKTLKAALQLNLDWGEELMTTSTDAVICHKRTRASVSTYFEVLLIMVHVYCYAKGMATSYEMTGKLIKGILPHLGRFGYNSPLVDWPPNSNMAHCKRGLEFEYWTSVHSS